MTDGRKVLGPGRAVVAALSVLLGSVGIAGSTPAEALAQVAVVPDSAEVLAREAIQAYYQALYDAAQRIGVGMRIGGSDLGSRPETCRGSTLQECFGGDMRCTWWGHMCDATLHAADRVELLGELEALQTRFPESDFVVGQLVDFALKDGDAARALEAGDRCQATLWWCQALRGYALHALSPGSGDLRFDSALANAPDGELAFGSHPDDSFVPDRGLTCEWTNGGRLWPDDVPDGWAAGECGARPDLQDRFWWLADPLWTVTGNPRHGEHISRNMAARLLYDLSYATMDMSFWWHPFNLHDEWTRNGFYNSWRTIVRIHQARPDTTHQLYVYGGYSFAPDADRLVRPEASTAEDWAVEWDEGWERMHWDADWHSIADHQIAVLRRDGGLVVLTAARLPVLVSSFSGVEAALAMGRPSDLSLETTPAEIDETGVMRAELPLDHGPWLASIEATGPGWVGRARSGAPAPSLTQGAGMSRPILVDTGFVAKRDSLGHAMLPSLGINRGRVGIYFELYGVDEEQAVELRLSLERTDRSLLGRIGGLFGLSEASALSVAWTDVVDDVEGQGYVPRHMEVDLSGLDPGSYELVVGVSLGDDRTLSASVPVTVRSEP